VRTPKGSVLAANAEAFDKMQGLMFELVWSFRLMLGKADSKRAAKFDAGMQKLVQQNWATLYRFY
jgi:hypothetical protein